MAKNSHDSEEIGQLLDNFSKMELAKMCAGFSKEAMKLTHWLYIKHQDILREYEDEVLGGTHIAFADGSDGSETEGQDIGFV
jgi:hypothetical protein